MMVKLPLITNSRLRAYRRCPRLHDISYVQGYRPVETSSAMYFGTLVHLGLEGWWGSGLAFGLQKMRMEESNELELIKAEELLKGYDARWKNENWETLAVEKEFEFDFHGYRLGGKIDAIARRDGRIYLVEHKTTSSSCEPGSDYWQRVSVLDSQVSMYYYAAKALGYDIAGCLYDVLYRPNIRPYKTGAKRKEEETGEEFGARLRSHIADEPEKYYQRGILTRTETDEASFTSDLLGWLKRITTDVDAPRNTEACYSYNRNCEYVPVCSGTAELTNPLKYRKVLELNEELNGST